MEGGGSEFGGPAFQTNVCVVFRMIVLADVSMTFYRPNFVCRVHTDIASQDCYSINKDELKDGAANLARCRS